MNLVTSAVLLFGAVFQLQAESESHSLYYIYTALSKHVSAPGIHEFTAMGLLDDREIDYYNSQDKVKIPRQHWMRESLTADYWEKGTQSRKSKEQWFKVNVNILMDRMKHNQSDVHVLQWRHGCEVYRLADGSVRFVSGVDQYSYDGSDFLSFDDATMQWVAPVDQAVPTKRKWDDVPILNQYTKGYLEKECVDWLSKFMTYGEEDLKKHSPPEVFAFARRATTPNKLTLTCMATGFYPKDVTLNIRKNRITLYDNEMNSTGVRPNSDGTYQLRKSVEIPEAEKADYDCWVYHRTLKEPTISVWDGRCSDCQTEAAFGGLIGGVIGALFTLAVVAVVVFVLHKKGLIRFPNGHAPVMHNSNGANGTSNGVGNGVNGHNGTHVALLGNGANGTSNGVGNGAQWHSCCFAG
ncbi:H-2 class I histocompatibility antigen, Q10 alpha chain isoform X1 [Chanos chanos]|uniref:H-2 class I histocompatibility antigen, Q10 alpha chain isoform X1 n=1 Tax=Chanos chanos TaxID=29144 RepID=A0A6J2WG85_CHACN|nr:H-2 class I histocompatibility antigen, Q10 alpha chain-like isoform X1 [Chanos chanos]